MKVHVGIVSALVLLGIALGFWAGKSSAGGEGQDAENKIANSGNAEKEGGGSGPRGRSTKGGVNKQGKKLGRSPKGGSPTSFIRNLAERLQYDQSSQWDYERMLQIYQEISWMSADDLEVAYAELEGLGFKEQSNQTIAMMLIDRWAKLDGKGAVEALMDSKEPMMKMQGLMTALMKWAKQDPSGSYAWYEKHGEELGKTSYLGGYMRGAMLGSLAMENMDLAFEKLGDLNSVEQTTAINGIAQQLSHLPEQRGAFIEKLEAMESKTMKEAGFSSLIMMWAARDAEGAVEFMETREWSEGTATTIKTQIASTWAYNDPESALDWRSKNLGENENAQEVLGHTFGQWVLRDSEKAKAWLAKQPEEFQGDSLNHRVSQSLYWQQQHEQASEWISQIEGEAVQKQATLELYQSWRMADKEKANAWRDTLDADIQQQLKDLPEPGANPSIPVPTLEVVQ